VGFGMGECFSGADGPCGRSPTRSRWWFVLGRHVPEIVETVFAVSVRLSSGSTHSVEKTAAFLVSGIFAGVFRSVHGGRCRFRYCPLFSHVVLGSGIRVPLPNTNFSPVSTQRFHVFAVLVTSS